MVPLQVKEQILPRLCSGRGAGQESLDWQLGGDGGDGGMDEFPCHREEGTATRETTKY